MKRQERTQDMEKEVIKRVSISQWVNLSFYDNGDVVIWAGTKRVEMSDIDAGRLASEIREAKPFDIKLVNQAKQLASEHGLTITDHHANGWYVERGEDLLGEPSGAMELFECVKKHIGQTEKVS